MKRLILLTAIISLLSTNSASANDGDSANKSLFVADKTWKWQPTNISGGAVWGNGGHLGGYQDNSSAIAGGWWGCGTVDGDSPGKFDGQLSHSATGKLTGEEYSSSSMIFKTDGTIEKYDKDGKLLNTGTYKFSNWNDGERYNSYGMAKLTTSAGAILWPFQINTGGYMPSEFEVTYVSKDRLVLQYASPGTGAWGESTWWSFGSDDGVDISPDYGKRYFYSDGIKYVLLESHWGVCVASVPDDVTDVVIPENATYHDPSTGTDIDYYVTEIYHDAFNGKRNIRTVTLPSSIIKIGKRAFASCTGLEEIEFNTITPPSINVEEDAFAGVNKKDVTLVVYDGLENEFREKEAWSGFNIRSKSFELIVTPLLDRRTIVEGQTIYFSAIAESQYVSYNMWSESSDPDVVELVRNDFVVGKKPGKATITFGLYNTTTEIEIEVLESFKIPDAQDDTYIVEDIMGFEGWDFRNQYDEIVESEPIVFNYLYADLPELEWGDDILVLSFETENRQSGTFGYVGAHLINDTDYDRYWPYPNSIEWGLYYMTSEYKGKKISNTLVYDPSRHSDKTVNKGLRILLVNNGYNCYLSDLKLQRFIDTSKVIDIPIDSDVKRVELYTLQGVKVEKPNRGQVYIKVENGKASKVLIK